MSHLAHIVRHPIKSIGYQELSSASLIQGRALPFDRVWALAHEAAKFTGQPTEWYGKRNFVRGVAGPQLMAIRAELDEDAETLTLIHPTAGQFTGHPMHDAAALIDWLRPMWPDNRPAPSHMVSLPGQALTDVPDPFVAVLNLSSLRTLSQRMGQDLSIHRFRGNLWVDGWAPWEEFDLIGREIRVGGATLQIAERITRCEATCVNPATGARDTDTLTALETAYDHRDFGVYARVVQSGPIAVTDTIEIL